MQLWSYRHAVAIEGHVVEVDGGSSGDPLATADFLTKLGSEGWELAFVVSPGEGRIELFFRKDAIDNRYLRH